MDHDQRFKTLIREFFADFLGLFFAAWAGRFDLTQVEWLDQRGSEPHREALFILRHHPIVDLRASRRLYSIARVPPRRHTDPVDVGGPVHHARGLPAPKTSAG